MVRLDWAAGCHAIGWALLRPYQAVLDGRGGLGRPPLEKGGGGGGGGGRGVCHDWMGSEIASENSNHSF